MWRGGLLGGKRGEEGAGIGVAGQGSRVHSAGMAGTVVSSGGAKASANGLGVRVGREGEVVALST